MKCWTQFVEHNFKLLKRPYAAVKSHFHNLKSCNGVSVNPRLHYCAVWNGNIIMGIMGHYTILTPILTGQLNWLCFDSFIQSRSRTWKLNIIIVNRFYVFLNTDCIRLNQQTDYFAKPWEMQNKSRLVLILVKKTLTKKHYHTGWVTLHFEQPRKFMYKHNKLQQGDMYRKTIRFQNPVISCNKR